MDRNNLFKILNGSENPEVEAYIKYCLSVETATKSGGAIANPWMKHRTDQQLADYFKAVVKDGLPFDGKHITLISTGVSYDYVAYKNKMLLAYPESLIDVGMVYKDDEFSFKKESGHVHYRHDIANPFGSKETDIVGGYCVIKNKRGEFLTLLSADDIAKHRKVAKTDSFWIKWFVEMCLKTIIKKACKQHFDDIYQNIETLDNENYDLEQSLEITVDTKGEVEALKTVPEVEQYYRDNIDKNQGIQKDFIKTLSARKEAIVKAAISEDDKNADS